MTFSRKPRRALPIARVLSPFAFAAVAGLGLAGAHAPAMAQKKDRKEQAAPKASYSKGFVAAYRPLEAILKNPAPDFAAAKAALPAVAAAAETPDDKMALGQAVVSIGQKSNDSATLREGIDMVLASGRADPTQQGPYSLLGAQLAYNAKDYTKALALYQGAIAAGETRDDPQLGVADSYIASGQVAEGLAYLSSQIEARKAAGQPVPDTWLKRGVASAYNNKLSAEAQRWALLYAKEQPNRTSWNDAVAIVINTSRYAPPEMLDLLRLARATGTMQTRDQYLEYVDAADARKLPQEVVSVIDAGVAAKLLTNDIAMVQDARSTASARIASDRTELPSLQRDASAAGAKLVTVMAAADTLLSYGKYPEAEAMYAKAASLAGANAPLIQTRQGIAQFYQGKHDEAQASFAKVQGPRKPIADLWALHSAQKAAGTVIGPAATAPAPAAAGS